MKLSEIKDYLIYPFQSEKELIESIEIVSENFTEKREQVEVYLKDPKLVAAYTAFYLTTNYPKFTALMDKIGETSAILKDCDVIDIGCGPGTFLFAYRDHFKNTGRLYGIETSELMRKQAKKLQDAFGIQNMNIQERFSGFGSSNLLMIFGHSINEMGPKAALKYIELFKPKHILVIEPGTTQAFKPLMNMRSILVKKGFNMHYPCPTTGICPMLGTDWCHQYLYVKQEDDVSRIAQMAQKNRNLLPVTAHLYSYENISKAPKSRLVRFLLETKHSFEWIVCLDDNGNRLQVIEIPKRNMTKEELLRMENSYAGDNLSFEIIKILADGKWRVQIN